MKTNKHSFKAIWPRLLTPNWRSAAAATVILASAIAGARAESVLFSQPFTNPATVVAVTISDTDLPLQVADNFALATDGFVTTVHWWGSPSTAAFAIRFFADESRHPAQVPFFATTVSPTSQEAGAFPYNVSVFTAVLASPIVLSGGATYYLSIVENVVENPRDTWSWLHSNASGNDAAYWLRPADSDAWQAESFAPNKLTFELLGGPLNADLSVAIATAPNPVRRTTDLTYVIHVANSGPFTALNVLLEDVLPSDSTFRSITTSGTASTPPVGSTGTVLVYLGNLASGQSTDVKVVVRANAKGGSTLRNTATVSSDVDDPLVSNNTATVITGVFGSRK